MAISFGNRLKGKITQSLLETLLEDVNFRIVPLGIEEIVREVKYLNMEEYQGLNLPTALRKLPDFFVSLTDFSKSFLIEVKFRKAWSNLTKRQLGDQLREQVQTWHPIYLVVFLGEPARQNETPASFLGVAKLVYQNGEVYVESGSFEGNRDESGIDNFQWVPRYTKWQDITWNTFSRFQDVFDGVADRWQEGTITSAIEMIRSLNELDSVNE